LEQELSLKASLVDMLRRDLEDVGTKLRAEEAKNRHLTAENQQLRLAAEYKQRQTQGKIFSRYQASRQKWPFTTVGIPVLPLGSDV
jgi:hypothetical protein